jgi:hypothetical protein
MIQMNQTFVKDSNIRYGIIPYLIWCHFLCRPEALERFAYKRSAPKRCEVVDSVRTHFLQQTTIARGYPRLPGERQFKRLKFGSENLNE